MNTILPPNRPLVERVEDPRMGGCRLAFNAQQRPAAIQKAIRRLRRSVIRYYRIDAKEKLSYREIGTILHISGERVRQIYLRASWKDAGLDTAARRPHVQQRTPNGGPSDGRMP